MKSRSLAPLFAKARRFLDWWASELSELLSIGASSRKWDVLFLRRETGCDVFVRSGERIEQVGTPQTGSDELVKELRGHLGRRSAARLQIVLRLQPGEIVQSRVNVPAAARDVMEPVLRHQIERLAPWPAEKAVLAYEIAGPAQEAGMLDVRVAITSRQKIDALVEELASLGYRPGVVDFGPDTETEPRLNLLPSQSTHDRRTGQRVLSMIAIAYAVAVIVSALGLLGVAQNLSELSSLNSQLEQLRARSGLDQYAEGFARDQRREALLAAEKLAQPSSAIVLEVLSRAVPDDAWLDRLEIVQGAVRLVGNAANATAIIGRIEESGHFADVQFAAPTTRAETDNFESFTITAQVVPGKVLEP
jgi:general secretion pathway protein L